MSEILVEDDTSYPADITVPEDGDARNAASVVVSFQALTNRLAHIWSRFANELINGGSIAIANAVTWALGNEISWTFTGSDSNITFGTGTRAIFNRNVRGALFTAGTTGRANSKVLKATIGSNQAIDPLLYDSYIYSPTTTGLELQLVDQTYESGDKFRVHNGGTVSGRTLTVKSAGGSTLVVVPICTTIPSYRELTYDGTAWQVTAFGDG